MATDPSKNLDNRGTRIAMSHVVCPQCHERFDMPDDLVQAQCERCGQAFGLAETHVTAASIPAASQAIQPFVEKPAGASGNAAIELPEHYASWEEFRALSPTIQTELLKLAIRLQQSCRSRNTCRSTSLPRSCCRSWAVSTTENA
jgi:hypothetical protein